MNDVLQDIPGDDRRYATAHKDVTSFGGLQSDTSEEGEEVEEEMFMTPPESLSGYGLANIIKLFDTGIAICLPS